MGKLSARLTAFSYHFDTVIPLTSFELVMCVCYQATEVNNGYVVRTELIKYLEKVNEEIRRSFDKATLLDAMVIAYNNGIVLTNDPKIIDPRKTKVDPRIARELSDWSPPIIYYLGDSYKELVKEAAGYWYENYHKSLTAV